jgi:hypothetical protein
MPCRLPRVPKGYRDYHHAQFLVLPQNLVQSDKCLSDHHALWVLIVAFLLSLGLIANDITYQATHHHTSARL